MYELLMMTNQAMKFGKTNISPSPSESTPSKQAFSQFLVCLLLTGCPNQFSHTLIPATISPSPTINFVKNSWYSLQDEAQTSQLLNYNKVSKCTILIMVVQQLKDIFRTAGKNLHTWLNLYPTKVYILNFSTSYMKNILFEKNETKL
jgi:hypothetical protein